MPKTYEIFAALSPAITEDLFSYLHDKEKPLYKATIESLATQRKLRPVFVERKPRVERHLWLRDALARKIHEAAAAHLLQIWLVGAHSKLLCDFLDALGIAHEPDGTVEDLPAAPAKEALSKAVDSLIQKHDPALVAVYLNAFQALDQEGGWPTLAELLTEDSRLSLQVPTAA